jgi:hypothetical protein
MCSLPIHLIQKHVNFALGGGASDQFNSKSSIMSEKLKKLQNITSALQLHVNNLFELLFVTVCPV